MIASPFSRLSAVFATFEAVERFLWKRGFRDGPVRRVAATLTLVAAGLTAAGLVLLPLTTWPFWLGAGAALSAWNFYSLALFVQRLFPAIAAEANARKDAESGADAQGPAARGLLLGQLLRSNLRLFITGILVYMALVVCRANPFALMAGLSAAVVAMPPLLLTRGGGRA